MTHELGEMHWKDGLMFKRLDDGSVRIRLADTYTAVIPPVEWISLLQHLGKEQTAEAFQVAREFHLGETSDDPSRAI